MTSASTKRGNLLDLPLITSKKKGGGYPYFMGDVEIQGETMSF